MATNRHISCGALELKDLRWNQNSLSGTSSVVREDEYIIYIHEPAGFQYEGVQCTGAQFAGSSKNGDIREIRLKTDRSGEVNWKIKYKF